MSSSQKRVLHVLSGMNRGGAETMVMNLYRKMDRSKVQFDFLTYRNDPCAYDEEILSLGGRLFMSRASGKATPYICEECKKHDKRKRAVQRHSCTHRFSNGLYRPCGKACWSAGQGMPFPQYVVEDRLHWKDRLQLMVFRRLILANATALCACGEDAGRFLFGQSNMERSVFISFRTGLILICSLQMGKGLMKKKQHAALQLTVSSLAMWPGFMK